MVVQLQLQQQALALHDGALTGLGVHDGLLAVVAHDVQVGLFEVPGVDVDVEEVDPGHVAEELPLEHVKVTFGVDEDRVKHQRLVRVQAVEGFATAHGESGVLEITGFSRRTRLTFGTFCTREAPGARRTLVSRFSWCSSVSTFSFVTCADGNLSNLEEGIK